MTAIETDRLCVAPFGAEDQMLIRRELTYLLSTPHFTGSKRYPAFLKWVVEKTLAGNATDLKERTIGVELFGKAPDYDTANDTIVRFTAGEVRKRLVLAYHHDRTPAIRIGLPPGSYIPEFVRADSNEHAVEEGVGVVGSAHPPLPPEEIPLSDPAPVRSAMSKGWMVFSALAVIATLFAVLFLLRASAVKDDSALNRFWQPFQASGSTTIIATGAVVPSKVNDFGLTPATGSDRYPYVSLASATTVAHVGGLLERKGVVYVVESSARLTLPDMVQHPTVLIGTFNNEWTLRLLSNLRYGVTNKHEPGIVDSLNPAQVWRPEFSQGVRMNDYAIVARFHDKLTENTVVLVAGLEKNGTEAAAQFVTDRRYLDLLDKTQPHGWSSKNIEIVIRANVVNGQSGAPEAVAVHTW